MTGNLPNPYRGKRVASQRSNNREKPHEGREKKQQKSKKAKAKNIYTTVRRHTLPGVVMFCNWNQTKLRTMEGVELHWLRRLAAEKTGSIHLSLWGQQRHIFKKNLPLFLHHWTDHNTIIIDNFTSDF